MSGDWLSEFDSGGNLHEYALKCSKCGSVKVMLSGNSVDSDEIWTDCSSCNSTQVEMEKVSLSRALDGKLLSHHLREFLIDENDSMSLTRKEMAEVLRDVADEVDPSVSD